jgi:hypothetical protein
MFWLMLTLFARTGRWGRLGEAIFYLLAQKLMVSASASVQSCRIGFAALNASFLGALPGTYPPLVRKPNYREFIRLNIQPK